MLGGGIDWGLRKAIDAVLERRRRRLEVYPEATGENIIRRYGPPPSLQPRGVSTPLVGKTGGNSIDLSPVRIRLQDPAAPSPSIWDDAGPAGRDLEVSEGSGDYDPESESASGTETDPSDDNGNGDGETDDGHGYEENDGGNGGRVADGPAPTAVKRPPPVPRVATEPIAPLGPSDDEDSGDGVGTREFVQRAIPSPSKNPHPSTWPEGAPCAIATCGTPASDLLDGEDGEEVMPLDEGDVVVVLFDDDPEWIYACKVTGFGAFPSTMVETRATKDDEYVFATVVADYEYQGADRGFLSLRRGDIILVHLADAVSGWWLGAVILDSGYTRRSNVRRVPYPDGDELSALEITACDVSVREQSATADGGTPQRVQRLITKHVTRRAGGGEVDDDDDDDDDRRDQRDRLDESEFEDELEELGVRRRDNSNGKDGKDGDGSGDDEGARPPLRFRRSVTATPIDVGGDDAVSDPRARDDHDGVVSLGHDHDHDLESNDGGAHENEAAIGEPRELGEDEDGDEDAGEDASGLMSPSRWSRLDPTVPTPRKVRVEEPPASTGRAGASDTQAARDRAKRDSDLLEMMSLGLPLLKNYRNPLRGSRWHERFFMVDKSGMRLVWAPTRKALMASGKQRRDLKGIMLRDITRVEVTPKGFTKYTKLQLTITTSQALERPVLNLVAPDKKACAAWVEGLRRWAAIAMDDTFTRGNNA